jgi:hypothetical protein
MRRPPRVTSTQEYPQTRRPGKSVTSQYDKTEYPRYFATVTAQNLLSPGTDITLNESPSLGYFIMTCIPPERNQDYINPVSHNGRVFPQRPNHIHYLLVAGTLCYAMRRPPRVTSTQEYPKPDAPANPLLANMIKQNTPDISPQ